MAFNQIKVPSHLEQRMDEAYGSTHSTFSPGAAGLVNRDNAMSWEEIDRLIKRWDVEPFGARVYLVRIMRTKSSGEHGAAIFIPDDYAELSNDAAVIAVGCDATVRWRGADYLLQPGDTVQIAHWSGTNIRRWWNGSKEVMCTNSDDGLGMVETAIARKHREAAEAKETKHAR